jgi:hypothetical protein
MLTKRIKAVGADRTYLGQLIPVGTYYTIQEHEEINWMANTSLQTDVANGNAVVATATTDLNASDGEAYLQAINAQYLGGKKINTSGIGDQKKLIYDSASDTLSYSAESSGSAAGAKGHVQIRGNTAGSFSSTADLLWDDTKTGLIVGPDMGNVGGVGVAAKKDRNTGVQYIIQNANGGTQASTDLVAMNNAGTDDSGYVDVGINSSNFNDPATPLTGPGDSYIYCDGGNLTVGTSNRLKDLILHSGGYALTDERLRFIDNATAKEVVAKFSCTIRLPSRTTANRPTTPINGDTGYNSTTNKFEFYENGEWKNLGSGASSGYFQNVTLSDSSNPYLQTTNNSYTVLSRCIFPGSSVVSLTKILASVSTISGSYSLDIRIYDITNSLVIAEKLTITSTTVTIHDLGTISNVPVNQAIFEIQLRANGNASRVARCSSVLLRS